MKQKGLIFWIVLFVSFWMVNRHAIYAQQSPKTLTILYSNNLNGEIDPCPT